MLFTPSAKGVGIIGQEFWMPESGEAEFQLLFPPPFLKMPTVISRKESLTERTRYGGATTGQKRILQVKTFPKEAVSTK